MTSRSIGIFNCGIGNFRSLVNAIQYISNYQIILSEDIEKLTPCNFLVLPGVGSFSTASESKNLIKLTHLINHFDTTQKPVLGICLGMQLLFNSSAESGRHSGLRIIDSDINHFRDHPSYDKNENLLVPHVGFNKVKQVNTSQLFNCIPIDSRFYFTHSFFAPPDLPCTLTETIYGNCKFTSSVRINNIFAVQFHPELSGTMGLRLLQNFLSL